MLTAHRQNYRLIYILPCTVHIPPASYFDSTSLCTSLRDEGTRLPQRPHIFLGDTEWDIPINKAFVVLFCQDLTVNGNDLGLSIGLH